MKLIEPTIAYERQIREYRSKFLYPGASMDGGGSLIRYENVAEWLELVRANKSPETVKPGLVPATQYVFVREEDEKIVGVLQIRHFLNPALVCYSGHIGYSVAPDERRKGYATQMLRLALDECRKRGIRRALITCVRGNEGSRMTILKCGGVWESTVYQAEKDRYLERYWIDL